MKSLLNLCLSYISENFATVGEIERLPPECRGWLLEWLVAHDILHEAHDVIFRPNFLSGLRDINLYMSDQVNFELLAAIGSQSKQLKHISIVYCTNVNDCGLRAITRGQKCLSRLEIRGLKDLTANSLADLASQELTAVDVSGCISICSRGILNLIAANPNIDRLCINGCTNIDDLAIFAIGRKLGSQLKSLEMDCLKLSDPTLALNYLSDHCPKLQQLSLCNYFNRLAIADSLHFDCNIKSLELRDIDLYGNYLSILPILPCNLKSVRLSCCGAENVRALARTLDSLPQLSSLKLALRCLENSQQCVDDANDFLAFLIPKFGSRITALQVAVPELQESTLRLIVDFCDRLRLFSLNAITTPSHLVAQIFQDPERCKSLKVVKFHQVRLPHKTLVTIAKGCPYLEELQVSFMPCVDDRFLKQVAWNCPELRNVNVNGCRWVTDKGICELARHCSLKEIRLRGTQVTDKCLYALAQCCPELEWIAHADYTGKPTFTPQALAVLKNSCIQRVIC